MLPEWLVFLGVIWSISTFREFYLLLRSAE